MNGRAIDGWPDDMLLGLKSDLESEGELHAFEEVLEAASRSARGPAFGLDGDPWLALPVCRHELLGAPATISASVDIFQQT